MSRFKWQEVTLSRVSKAVGRRIFSLPDLISWYFSPIGKKNRRRLKELRDSISGRNVLLMANGPSLRSVDFADYEGHFKIGLNRISLLEEEGDVQCNVVVCVNELVLEQFSDEFKRNELVFANWSKRNIFKNIDNIVFLRLSSRVYDKFSFEISNAVYSGGTVTYVALQVALYLGADAVDIVGLDHSFKDGGIPNKSEVREREVDSDHFHPDYFPKGAVWQLPDLVRSEYAYRIAKDAFESRCVSVTDRTINGKCDVFQKT
ncbi:6-hydroxymethylpterin diphosphokinase MptE-like protein [Spongiibacter tropicus]|uniref:6-hydroxymethylpterin diphosphokinase MptE-like protein n=1 Tax=Spongiibacter tropicus TaxID=454602 RepID=UPI003A992514